MNWDAIGAVGQVVSALALVLVIAQVRHARDEVRRSARHNRLDAARQLFAELVENERLNVLTTKANVAFGAHPSLFHRALMETAGMTREEAATLQNHHTAWWLFRVQVIANIGDLPPNERTEFDVVTRRAYHDQPQSRLWYECAKKDEGLANRDAVRYVDNLLAKPE